MNQCRWMKVAQPKITPYEGMNKDMRNLQSELENFGPIVTNEVYNLLEGISGIGLSIMTMLYHEKWSDILLLKNRKRYSNNILLIVYLLVSHNNK